MRRLGPPSEIGRFAAPVAVRARACILPALGRARTAAGRVRRAARDRTTARVAAADRRITGGGTASGSRTRSPAEGRDAAVTKMGPKRHAEVMCRSSGTV